MSQTGTKDSRTDVSLTHLDNRWAGTFSPDWSYQPGLKVSLVPDAKKIPGLKPNFKVDQKSFLVTLALQWVVSAAWRSFGSTISHSTDSKGGLFRRFEIWTKNEAFFQYYQAEWVELLEEVKRDFGACLKMPPPRMLHSTVPFYLYPCFFASPIPWS